MKTRALNLRAVLFSALLSAGLVEAGPVPKEELMLPPDGATHYLIVSDSNTHGDEWRWTTSSGAIAFRKSQSLRGWITETDGLVMLDGDGDPRSVQVRGVTPNGDAAESMDTGPGGMSWDSGADSGTAPSDSGFYLPRGGPSAMMGLLAERIVDAGELNLLPSGHARMREGITLHIEDEDGDIDARLLFIDGLWTEPMPVWVDGDGKHLATITWLGLIREGYEEHFSRMKQVQEDVAMEASRAIALRFLTEAARAPVLIDNVQLFDALRGEFHKAQAVTVAGGRITAIGPAGSLAVPEGGRRIDGEAKTLVPGLWDAHKHFGNGYDLLANVATGMTSIRSPGNDTETLTAAKKARAAGEMVAPEIFGAVIIDQVHPLSAQGADLVASEKEAIEAVRRAADNKLWGVKFYTSMNPEWIAPAAAEAHRRGLHVSGHVPATMRPLEAVQSGYDEITHINFIMMQALPQAVVDISNTAARMEGPAQYARDVDLDGPLMTRFISELKQRGTWVDPTIVIFESDFTRDTPELSPAIKPYAGTLPAVTERALNQGGYPLFGEVTREQFRESYAKLVELVGKLHQAGVPIVAGTDGQGIELVREIEIYEQAGMSKAAALQTATINPARLVGIDDRTGSITVGKEADLLLVDGDVSAELGALRRVHTVISDGYVMDGDELREAAGFSGQAR
ncbi:amidohydrolase family protein [Parahaliea maris]|uniref:Amidohydrolase family protein n=1 Tax=Parahaliea maris TaxID=2716870 RepID=A0A5C9A240_9GAMM|nr:amidohydrolase family protein [Parahaliea maris]TXS93840.1 amidohydrolase family protein [Parahaliea maris]